VEEPAKPGCSSRTAARQTPRDSLSASTLSRSGRSRLAPRDTDSESGVRPRGGRSQSLSGCISSSLPPLLSQAVSQGHEITGFGWIHARWRTYVRSISRSVGRSVGRPLSGKYFADKRSRDCAAHDKHTDRDKRTRSSHVSGFSSRLDINRLVNYESR